MICKKLLSAAVAVALSLSTQAFAQSRNFDVPAQSATTSIPELARQAGVQILTVGDSLDGIDTPAVSGEMDVQQALHQLIDGTNLEMSTDEAGVILLRQRKPDVEGSDVRSETELDTIVVTGSRVARPDLINPMPVSVTRMDEALELGRISAYDALARDPALGVGQNLSSSSSGWDAGISAVNLRNLGTNRSLTLIDGQRRVSSSARSSAVDLGMIPVGMIDRIEVVTGGAAAVYGADAVTGAVNIITKREIEGVHVMATTGVSAEGDASEHLLSLSTGGKFAEGRGRFVIGGSWSKTDPYVYADRFGMGNYLTYRANRANTGINDGIPDRIINTQTRQMYYDYTPTFWHDDKRWYIEDAGLREGACGVMTDLGQYSVCDGGDGRHLQDVRQLRAGNEALAVMGRAEFDVNDDTSVNGYFSYADQQYDGATTYWRDDSRTTYFSGNGTSPRGASAYLDNPYLPDSVRSYMEGNGLDQLYIDRAWGNFPIREEDHHRKTMTVGAEIKGAITDYVGWSAFAQFGKVTDDYTGGNLPWKSHWIAARDAIADPVTGQPVCRDESARAAGCVPFDIFSMDAPGQDVLDYVLADRHEKRSTSQQLFGAEVGGSLFSLPAGDLGFALGVEHRREALETRDDPLALSGELVYGGGAAAHPELDVDFDVTEVYAEAIVPLLADSAFAKRLDLEVAYRYSDYSTVGGTDAWKVGLIWEPIDGLAFRGVSSRSVRTPNFGELYEAQVNAMTGSINDPCEVASYYATEQRASNCLALGITEPLVDYKIGPTVVTGGNPDLAPESSDSVTFGFVWQPRFLSGFDMTVDYWDIDISNVITQFSYATLMKLCVDAPSIENPYCARVDRDPASHHATQVRSNQLNAARMYAKGVDFGFNYVRGLGNGQFGAALKASRLLDMVTETTPGISAGDVEYAGSWQHPDYRGTLTLDYRINDFNVTLDTRYLGKGAYDLNTDSDEAYPDGNYVGSTTYNDLSFGYEISSRYRIGFGVRNLFDREAPYKPTVYRDTSIHDQVGRSFYLTAKGVF